MALGSARMGCRVDGPMYRYNGEVDRISCQTSLVYLAVRQRSHGFDRYVGHRDIGHLRRQPRSAGDDVRAKSRHGCAVRSHRVALRMAPSTAWHLKDSRYPHLVSLQHRLQHFALHAALLDLRCEEGDCVGMVHASRWRKYVAHLPPARLLFLYRLRVRLHVLHDACQRRPRRGDTVCSFHRADTGTLRVADTMEAETSTLI